MCNKKKFITVRVDESLYNNAKKLADDIEDGNISKFIRNILEVMIENAKEIGYL